MLLLLKNTAFDRDSAVIAQPAAAQASTVICHNIENIIIIITNIPTFPDCENEMSSIPHTLQMTKAIRKNRKARGGDNQAQYYDFCAGAEQPTKYSSKMMNSIWGQYNELSVHNFKSLQCGGFGVPDGQDSQNMLQQTQQQAVPEQSSGFRQFIGELGQAVTNNFMDNMNQY